MPLVARFLADDDGAVAIEYGLIAALVGLAVIGAFSVFGDGLLELFGAVQNRSLDVIENADV